MYQAEKLQRKTETEVRHQKDRATISKAANDKDMYDESQRKIKLLRSKYKQLSEASGLPTKMERMRVDGFCKQTGLPRDRYREQIFATTTENDIKNWGESTSQKAVWGKKSIDFIKNNAIIKLLRRLPKRIVLPNEKIKQTVDVSFPNLSGVVPKHSDATNVYVMAGFGTGVPIRDLKRLHYTYGKSTNHWQKKSADVYANNYKYVVHWYENNGFAPPDEFKVSGIKELKK